MAGGTVALIVIDVQNDFCPGGALPVPDGDAVVPVLNRYIALFSRHGLPIHATRDWHPENTPHFEEYGGRWPPHCVQNTWGARYHPDLAIADSVSVLSKGMTVESEGYSGFEAVDSDGRTLSDLLSARGVNTLVVGGLATDYCVRATVLDAQQQGYQTFLATDATRGIDALPGDVDRAIEQMHQAGTKSTSFERVTDLVAAGEHQIR
jgi:nicotinamidase/pyrazinamidase